MSRVAVFSDVHGNLPALRAFVEAAGPQVESFVCLGDVVNYGPWSNECVDLVCSLPNIIFLEGNHERLFLGTEPIEHEIPLVRDFFQMASRGFSRQDAIARLPTEYRLGMYQCRHTVGDLRVYADTQLNADDHYLIGHTHHAFDVRRGPWRIVNCGSVGQNRKELGRASYAIVDNATDDVELREVEYDAVEVIEEMVRRDYPPVCIDYYRAKLNRKAI